MVLRPGGTSQCPYVVCYFADDTSLRFSRYAGYNANLWWTTHTHVRHITEDLLDTTHGNTPVRYLHHGQHH